MRSIVVTPPPSSTAAASTSTRSIHMWKSPLPYLYGGFAVTLLLISVALVILVCSYRKRSDSNSDSSAQDDQDQGQKLAMPTFNMCVLDMEPKIVVVMAGDDMPTYLANPNSINSLPSPSENTSKIPDLEVEASEKP